MPPSPLLFPTDLYCLFVQQVVISNTNHLGIVLKLLYKSVILENSEKDVFNSYANMQIFFFRKCSLEISK